MKRAPGYTDAQLGMMRWLDNMESRHESLGYNAAATDTVLLRGFGKAMEELSDTECAAARAFFPGRK